LEVLTNVSFKTVRFMSSSYMFFNTQSTNWDTW